MPTTKQASRSASKPAAAPKTVHRPKAQPATPAPSQPRKSTARAQPPAKVAQPVEAAKPVKALKVPKPVKPPKLRSKPVRDSFTMPIADFALIAALKARALGAGRETKKSELLRAGLHALAALEASALLAALGALAPVRVGRPKSGH